ncbi:ABC transporter ATP-binding protein [Actinomyces oris]|uniref:ABC transporter ATP-binding protein n=1 Tax=Actinomyces oris TaxID=544580 RepID=A0A508BHR9_9ACTO|nr:ABC transporter ATP-binding protein [Actinomyces oris]QQC39027.1 ABC transporter ATP-binding protein [Actinomyces oris]TQD58995.1 ABC transporter ATP-binding protein [Actinomyces oris]
MTDLPSTEPNTVAGPAAPGARLAARGATIAYERHVVSRNLDVDIPAGVFTAIVGPNACGKSTLLRALARLHRPARGAVLLDGADIVRLGTKEVARRVGLLPQSATVPGGMLVRDLVARGRFPHQGLFRQWSQQDRQAVEEAMEMVGVTELAARPVDELSGGQRQRVWIALALAQGTETILLDEPTTFLDLAHQVDILQLCRRLNADGRTVVAVLHDLNQAARCAEHMIVMHEGRIRTTGSPREILTEDLIEEVFGLAAVIAADPVAGTPMVVPRHLGAVVPAGTRSAPTDSTGGPAPQSSADPASAGTSPTARSQQDGQERNTDR